MDMKVDGSQINPTDPTTLKGGPQASVAETNDGILNLKGKVSKAIENPGPVSEDNINKSQAQYQQYSDQAKQLQGQIDALKASGAPASEIQNLESQMTALNTQLQMLQSSIDGMKALYASATGTPAPAGVINAYSNAPLLFVPLADLRQHATFQEAANLFLSPSLQTLIFAVMQKVVHQKLMTMDTYRQFMQQYIKYSEQFALQAAASAKMQGELTAQAQITQAAGLLVGAGLQIGLGALSIGMGGALTKSINKTYDEKRDELGARNATPEELNSNEAARQHALNNALQSDPYYRVTQLLEQIAPNIAQGAANMAAAKFSIDAAGAEAAKMLFQQAQSSAQAIIDALQQGFNANVQDITDFLQAVRGIAQAQTQQSV